MIKFAIEGILVAAVIVGFIFEERIALFERKVLKNIKTRLNLGTDEKMEARLREERFNKQQRIREAELLELGCNMRPELKVIRSAKTANVA